MAISTDAQREQWVAALKAGKVTDPQRKRKLLVEILAYDRMRGEAPPGAPSPMSMVPASTQPVAAPTAPIMRARTPIPGRSSEQVTRGQLQNEGFEHGVARFGQGVTDLWKRFTGRMSPEEREGLARQRLQETAEFDVDQLARAKAADVDPKSFNNMQTIGRMAPEIAIGGVAGLPKSLAGRVVAEGALSGLSSAVENPFDDNTAQNALIWSGIGSTVGLGMEVPGYVKGIVMRDAKGVANTFRTNRGFETGNEFGVDLSLAEASLDEKVARIESAVATGQEGPKGDFQRKRQVQMSDAFFKLANMLNPARMSTKTVARTLAGGYEKYVKGLQKVATDNFRDTLAKAAGSVGGRLDKRGRILGGDPVLMPRNLVAEIESITEQQGRVALVRGPEDDVSVRNVLDAMVDDEGQPVPLKLGDVQQLVSYLTDAAYSAGGPTANNLTAADRLGARNLLTALMEDVDKVVARRPSDPVGAIIVDSEGAAFVRTTDEVVAALQRARTQYRADKAPINALADTAFDKVLSGVGDVNSDTFISSLLQLETEDITAVMRLADSTKPGLANAIRGRVFADLVERHTKRAATSELRKLSTKLDIVGLANEFSNMPANKLQALLPMDVSTAELRKAQAGLTVLQRIAEGPNAGGTANVKSLVQRIENIAINAVSQNHFFVSRLLAGELSPNWIEKAMYTKEGVKALAALGSSNVSRGTATAAVTSLSRLLSESDQELQEARKVESERRLKDMQRATAIGF